MNSTIRLVAVCTIMPVVCLACSAAATSATAKVASDPSATDSSDLAPLTALAASSLALTPAFSTSIHDYYVRCAAGANAVTLSATSASGTQVTSVSLVEDELLTIQGDYFLRCLPHDFPTITVTTHPDVGAPTDGWYLASNASIAVGSSSFAMVLDTHGTPVWYQRETDGEDLDSPAVDTLSFMGAATAPFGLSPTASFSIATLGTSTVTSVMAVGSPTDGHELRTLSNGDHLLFTYVVTPGVDLTGLSTFGSGETIMDGEIQEISPSGSLVWSWLATDHIDPAQESLEPQTDVLDGVTVVDTFHLNSIDVDSSGNLLVSSRHMNAVFYVDKATGQIQWKMGGTPYNKDGAAYVEVVGDPQTTFSMQHDARLQPDGNVTLFDDHGAAAGVARGVEYAIDHTANTATVAWQFLGTAQSQYMGSFRREDDGERVIGWGYASPDLRAITETNAAGGDVLDIAFDAGNASYRAIKVPLANLDVTQLRSSAGQ